MSDAHHESTVPASGVSSDDVHVSAVSTDDSSAAASGSSVSVSNAQSGPVAYGSVDQKQDLNVTLLQLGSNSPCSMGGNHNIKKSFNSVGLCCGICCFPCGLYYCFAWRLPKCTKCDVIVLGMEDVNVRVG